MAKLPTTILEQHQQVLKSLEKTHLKEENALLKTLDKTKKNTASTEKKLEQLPEEHNKLTQKVIKKHEEILDKQLKSLEKKHQKLIQETHDQHQNQTKKVELETETIKKQYDTKNGLLDNQIQTLKNSIEISHNNLIKETEQVIESDQTWIKQHAQHISEQLEAFKTQLAAQIADLKALSKKEDRAYTSSVEQLEKQFMTLKDDYQNRILANRESIEQTDEEVRLEIQNFVEKLKVLKDDLALSIQALKTQTQTPFKTIHEPIQSTLDAVTDYEETTTEKLDLEKKHTLDKLYEKRKNTEDAQEKSIIKAQIELLELKYSVLSRYTKQLKKTIDKALLNLLNETTMSSQFIGHHLDNYLDTVNQGLDALIESLSKQHTFELHTNFFESFNPLKDIDVLINAYKKIVKPFRQYYQKTFDYLHNNAAEIETLFTQYLNHQHRIETAPQRLNIDLKETQLEFDKTIKENEILKDITDLEYEIQCNQLKSEHDRNLQTLIHHLDLEAIDKQREEYKSHAQWQTATTKLEVSLDQAKTIHEVRLDTINEELNLHSKLKEDTIDLKEAEYQIELQAINKEETFELHEKEMQQAQALDVLNNEVKQINQEIKTIENNKNAIISAKAAENPETDFEPIQALKTELEPLESRLVLLTNAHEANLKSVDDEVTEETKEAKDRMRQNKIKIEQYLQQINQSYQLIAQQFDMHKTAISSANPVLKDVISIIGDPFKTALLNHIGNYQTITIDAVNHYNKKRMLWIENELPSKRLQKKAIKQLEGTVSELQKTALTTHDALIQQIQEKIAQTNTAITSKDSMRLSQVKDKATQLHQQLYLSIKTHTRNLTKQIKDIINALDEEDIKFCDSINEKALIKKQKIQKSFDSKIASDQKKKSDLLKKLEAFEQSLYEKLDKEIHSVIEPLNKEIGNLQEKIAQYQKQKESLVQKHDDDVNTLHEQYASIRSKLYEKYQKIYLEIEINLQDKQTEIESKKVQYDDLYQNIESDNEAHKVDALSQYEAQLALLTEAFEAKQTLFEQHKQQLNAKLDAAIEPFKEILENTQNALDLTIVETQETKVETVLKLKENHTNATTKAHEEQKSTINTLWSIDQAFYTFQEEQLNTIKVLYEDDDYKQVMHALDQNLQSHLDALMKACYSFVDSIINQTKEDIDKHKI